MSNDSQDRPHSTKPDPDRKPAPRELRGIKTMMFMAESLRQRDFLTPAAFVYYMMSGIDYRLGLLDPESAEFATWDTLLVTLDDYLEEHGGALR